MWHVLCFDQMWVEVRPFGVMIRWLVTDVRGLCAWLVDWFVHLEWLTVVWSRSHCSWVRCIASQESPHASPTGLSSSLWPINSSHRSDLSVSSTWLCFFCIYYPHLSPSHSWSPLSSPWPFTSCSHSGFEYWAGPDASRMMDGPSYLVSAACAGCRVLSCLQWSRVALWVLVWVWNLGCLWI